MKTSNTQSSMEQVIPTISPETGPQSKRVRVAWAEEPAGANDTTVADVANSPKKSLESEAEGRVAAILADLASGQTTGSERQRTLAVQEDRLRDELRLVADRQLWLDGLSWWERLRYVGMRKRLNNDYIAYSSALGIIMAEKRTEEESEE
jgi:hypothetical protein